MVKWPGTGQGVVRKIIVLENGTKTIPGRQVVGQVKKVGKSRNFHQKVGKSRNFFC